MHTSWKLCTISQHLLDCRQCHSFTGVGASFLQSSDHMICNANHLVEHSAFAM
uniref:Uncharacterized protein n=1 Tax=Arundo donax TaxID=35708 RepID=A0A0A9DZ96_ARUDO